MNKIVSRQEMAARGAQRAPICGSDRLNCARRGSPDPAARLTGGLPNETPETRWDGRRGRETRAERGETHRTMCRSDRLNNRALPSLPPAISVLGDAKRTFRIVLVEPRNELTS